MRLIRAVFSGVLLTHDPIVDASIALNLLKATFIKSTSIYNLPRKPGLQTRSPFKHLDNGSKKVECKVMHPALD